MAERRHDQATAAPAEAAASNPAWTYEEYMVPTLFGPWASRLVAAADPQHGERVLDVGCGTGIVARRVAARLGADSRVSGVDINPNMLAVAREAAQREGVSVEWYEGRAERLPFPDASFDVVTCQFGLMFFAEQEAALSEMARVLVPGGRLALSVWQDLDRHPFYQTLDIVIQRRLGMSGVQDIFSLGNADELRGKLIEAGFQNITLHPASDTARFPHPEAFLAGEIDVDTAAVPSMQRLTSEERRRTVEAIQEEMAEPLRRVTDGDHVVLPFHAYIVMGQR